jgi:hypothetical protein
VLGELVPEQEGRLVRNPDPEATGVLVGHDQDGIRLERKRGQPLVDQPDPDDHVGVLQRPFIPNLVLLQSKIGPNLGEQDRRVGRQRGQHIRHHRQRLEVDHDGLGRIQGLYPGFGQNHCQGLPHETDNRARQSGTRETRRNPALHTEGLQADVLGSEDAHDSGHGAGLVAVEGGDPGMSDRRSDESG